MTQETQPLQPQCTRCGAEYPLARHALQRANKEPALCPSCGEKKARERSFCVAPMHKSNYLCITNPADLLGLNNKGGLIK